MGARGQVGSAGVTPIDLMIAIIEEHTQRSMWTDSPLEGYRRVSGNTIRGAIGEEFMVRCLL